MKMATVVLTLSLLVTTGLAQIKAVTGDGKVVLLHSDGTWEYYGDPEVRTEEKYDFRQAKWGDSISQVKATEEGEPQQQDNFLMYEDNVANLNATAFYVFAYDKLVRAGYIFQESHSNRNQYINDYSNIKNVLKETYGSPKKDDKKIWSKSLYKNDREDWGLAISIGHLTIYSSWENEDTDILLSLLGDNYKINHKVEYTSKRHSELEKKAKKEKAKRKL